MSARIVSSLQQGSRLQWNDPLFEQVEYVQPPAIDEVPQPEVTELDCRLQIQPVGKGSAGGGDA